MSNANSGPENYGTIWVCVCCMLTHANGECCADDTHGGDSLEPLNAIQAPFTVTSGLSWDEHADDCLRRPGNNNCDVPDSYECDCEKNTFSTSQCEGCGSFLHGERHAMTLFKARSSNDYACPYGCGFDADCEDAINVHLNESHADESVTGTR